MTEKGRFMLFRLLLLTVSLFIVSGCLSPEKPMIPEWVQHPPKATATELLGVSVAHSPKEAIVSAAGGIASGVLEAAEPRVEQEVSGNHLRHKTSAEMKAILQKMDYSSVKVKEEVAMDKETAVLVSIQRSTFADELRTRMQALSEKVTGTLNTHKNDPDYARLGYLGSLHEDRYIYLAHMILLETVDPTADLTVYKTQMKAVEDSFNTLKFGMGVTIISDPNAIVFVETMKMALRAEGINPLGTPAGTLLLYADSQQDHSGASFTVKTRLRIESTIKGTKIVQSEHFLQAQSSQSYADASRKTSDALAKIIKYEGLFHTLGF